VPHVESDVKVALTTILLTASIGQAEVHRATTVMSDADGDVCSLLRAEVSDSCKRVAKLDANTSAYQSGSTRGIRRVVLVVRDGDRQLVSQGIDLYGDGAKLTVQPTIRAIHIDGKPGVLLDVVGKFARGKDAWTTEAFVGCALDNSWKCMRVELPCQATADDDGAVSGSCGQATLSLR
jgi:hypothetical protein